MILSRPKNFTLGLRLQNKKRHDVDRLMVSVMSFIVYGGVSGEGVGGNIGIAPAGEDQCASDWSAPDRTRITIVFLRS